MSILHTFRCSPSTMKSSMQLVQLADIEKLSFLNDQLGNHIQLLWILEQILLWFPHWILHILFFIPFHMFFFVNCRLFSKNVQFDLIFTSHLAVLRFIEDFYMGLFRYTLFARISAISFPLTLTWKEIHLRKFFLGLIVVLLVFLVPYLSQRRVNNWHYNLFVCFWVYQDYCFAGL